MRQYAVIGLGKFGRSVALTLIENGEQVIGIDSNEMGYNHLSIRS